MRTIIEYLSANVNVNKGFPKIQKLNDVIDFLLKEGFKEIKLNENNKYNYESIWKKLENQTLKGNNAFVYDISNSNCNEHWIRFCKAGRLNKENPVYFLRLNKIGKITCNDVAYIELRDPESGNQDDIKFTNYEDFRKEVNNYFNW